MVAERFKVVYLLTEDAVQLLLVGWLYDKDIDQNLNINPRQSNALNLTFSIINCIYNRTSAMASTRDYKLSWSLFIK